MATFRIKIPIEVLDDNGHPCNKYPELDIDVKNVQDAREACLKLERAIEFLMQSPMKREAKTIRCEMHTAGNGHKIIVFKDSPAEVGDRLMIRYNGVGEVLAIKNGILILKWDDADINGWGEQHFQYKVEQ
jgi:hypothetical protein